MSMQVDNNSRWKFSEPIVNNGKETFGRWTRPDFLIKENVPDNETMTVQVDQSLAGRPDLIALKYYKASTLEWVVIMFNRPLNPIGWPTAGTIIKLPSYNVVYSAL